MTTYRELVQRVLTCRHADTELGLGRAREQEGFILDVSRLLDKGGWTYRVRMDSAFNVTFAVEWDGGDFETQIRALWQTVAATYPVHRYGDVIEVDSVRPDGYGCRIVFGDVPQ